MMNAAHISGDSKVIRGHSDWFILLAVLGMLFFSLAFVYSASAGFSDFRTGSTETFFWSHAMRVLLGIGVMLVFARLDYHWLERFSKPMLVVALGLLIFVLIEGEVRNGATRWIDLGFISFQPSELAKFALVAHLSVMLADKQSYITDFKRSFLPMLFWIVLVCAMVALQPNFSTASTIFMIAIAVLLIGRAHLAHLTGVIVAGGAAAAVYALSAGYRMERLVAYMQAMFNGNGMAEINYQLHQGLLAFGSGGLIGVGAGQSRQRLFVPEPFGDFIYAIIGEEYGFIGAVLLLGVFGLIIWRGLLVARQAKDELGRNIAAGITVTIGAYAIINAGVTTGLLPTTGLPMPFISYGGTAVLFSAAAIGVLLNVSQQANVMPLEKPSVEHGGHTAEAAA
jgi:cell division protein FtsW